MVVKEESVEFEHIPTIVIVGRELSWAVHQYFTFLSEEGCGSSARNYSAKHCAVL
jgi:hypothetical protein